MKTIGIFLIVATTLFPAYQLFSLPSIADKLALFSQYLGMAALILMAWGQVLSTRLLGIEAVFGGMDRVYILHKWAGIVAMIAILLHDTIDADMQGLGPETALNELAETLGELSLYGLLILVVVSVATFIPYHLWKWTHKAMGAFFATATFHFFFIMKPFAMIDPAGLYTGAFCLAGIAAYGWMLLPERMRPSYCYAISALNETGGAVAVTLIPAGKAIYAEPGQFGVLRFSGAGWHEPHPFSFSMIGSDGTLRVTVKPLGDFTTRLQRFLKVGQDVHVQGPFGRFRLTSSRRQVWIAGGIGVTPFLSWAKALRADGPNVDMFYCVKSRKGAPHLAELQDTAKATLNLHLHIIASDEGKRLSAEIIAETVADDLSGAKVSFCGPVSLRETLQSGMRRYGVSAARFQFEEFEFRTGIGLKRLATWILGQKSLKGPGANRSD